MSSLPQKPINPIKTKQEADSLLWYLSKIKPQYRYSYDDCLRDIEEKQIEEYFSSKASEMNLFSKNKGKLSNNNGSHISESSDTLLQSNDTNSKTNLTSESTRQYNDNVKKNSHEDNHNNKCTPSKEKTYARELDIDFTIASCVSASDFTITDGCIKYKDYTLQSVKIQEIPADILQQIDHKFKLQHDYLRKNQQNGFMFNPPTDLSLLLSEAEKLMPKRKHSSQTKYPQSGTFGLPWNFVKFYNGEMMLIHPKPSQRGTLLPYRYRHLSIVAAFNDIKHYIQARVPRLIVTSRDGVIVGVENFRNFKKAIPQFLNHIKYNEADYIQNNISQSALKVGRAYTLNQLHDVIRKSKSPYLAFLSEKQITSKKIYYIIEYSVHEKSSTDEYGFIFTIRNSNDGVTTVVFENSTDESRSSLIFFIETKMYQIGIQHIINFLASDMVNKRQKLAYQSIAFKSNAIRWYCRVVHQNFYDWKWRMLSFI
jgi:hypothetical protein